METHTPGVVDDIGDREERGRPGEGSHNAWGGGTAVMKAVGVLAGK